MRVSIMSGEAAGTIVRVVRLLRCLAEAEGDVSITELSRLMGLAPSTIHRLLNLLLQEGMVARSEARSLYQPGMEFIRLGALVTRRSRIGEVARGFMQAMVDDAGEACMLTQLLPHEEKVMVTAAIASPHPLRYAIDMFQGSDLTRGATGLSILAFLPDERISGIVEAEREPKERDAVLAEIARVRERGYALTRGQKIPGAVGLGAPVFNADNKVVAALCVTIPEQRFDEAQADRLAELLLTQARGLSQTLGHHPR